MRFHVKPYGVPNRRESREVRATATPKAEPVFTIDADTDTAARSAIRERFARIGRAVRSINCMDATDTCKLVVYAEAK